MRKLLAYFLFIFLFVHIAHAQNYRMIFPERIMYYECIAEESDVNTTINSIIVDSVVTNSAYASYYFKPQLEMLEDLDYRLEGMSFSGEKADVYPSGDYIFRNLRGDSIVIKTAALLNQKWVSYIGESGDSLIARVTALSKDEIFKGIEDSVKTITLKYVNSSIPLGQNSLVSEFEINISKNYGAIETVNFKHFPNISQADEYFFTLITKPIKLRLKGLTNPTIGVQNLTWKAIHDYNKGDVFHRSTIRNSRYEGVRKGVETHRIERVLDITVDGDTNYYFIKRFTETNGTDNDSTWHTFKTDTLKLSISANRTYDHEPGYYGRYENEIFLSNLKLQNDTLQRQPCIGGSVYEAKMSIPLVDMWGIVIGPYYRAGLGMFNYSYESEMTFEGMFDENKVVYYKKGNIEWGTPFNMDTLQTLDALPEVHKNKVNAFPNPCKNLLHFTGIEKLVSPTIEVYDISGKLLLAKPINDLTLDVSGLEQGAYLYNLKLNSTVYFKGRFIKE